MPTIAELTAKKEEHVNRAQQIREAATKENRLMTAEERTNFDEACDAAQAIDEQAEQVRQDEERASRLENIEAATRQSTGRRSEPMEPGGDGNGDGGSTRTIRVRNGRTGEYEELPLPEQHEEHACGFRKFLLNGLRAPFTDGEMRSLTQSSDVQGGYLSMPMQFVSELIKFVDDMVFIRRLGTVYSVRSSDSLGAPSLEADPEDSDWTSEIGTVDEDTQMELGKRELTPHQLTKLIKVSRKLMRTAAMSPEALVRDRLGYKVAVTQEKGFMTGSGANQPLGLFTASADGIPTSQDVNACAAGDGSLTLDADKLIEAFHTLKAAYWSRAAWLFNRASLKQVRQLKHGDGTYIWMPGLQAGNPGMILDRPYYVSEYVPNTDDSSWVTTDYVGMIGDFSKYWIADSLAMEIQRLEELYAANNQIGFISRSDTDGMPVLAEAFVRLQVVDNS